MTNDKPSADDESIPRSVKQDAVPTEGESELTGTLEEVAQSGKAQCRFCDHVVEGDSFGEIFEKLAEHGEDEHEWDDNQGWNA